MPAIIIIMNTIQCIVLSILHSTHNTFKKQYLQSSGYFVITKLKTCPTTGISASVITRKENILISSNTTSRIVNKEFFKNILPLLLCETGSSAKTKKFIGMIR